MAQKLLKRTPRKVAPDRAVSIASVCEGFFVLPLDDIGRALSGPDAKFAVISNEKEMSS